MKPCWIVFAAGAAAVGLVAYQAGKRQGTHNGYSFGLGVGQGTLTQAEAAAALGWPVPPPTPPKVRP